jgi:hypothetical protein
MKTTEYAGHTEMKKGLLMTIILFQTSVCSACSMVRFFSGESGIGFNREKTRKAAKSKDREAGRGFRFFLAAFQISRFFAFFRGSFSGPKNCSRLSAG